MEIKELITEFSKTRPEADIIVGYGSKVKSQANDKGIQKQIDLILGVNDAIEWHQLNHLINPDDYRSKLGYGLLPLYHNFGTPINYISYLTFNDHMFKIGVVETKSLIQDLSMWDNFFLAGRFQKPIEVIKGSSELNLAIKVNRINALKTALLASGKEKISERELYETLCSLSFIGDWRQLLHIENKNKVRNIVSGSFDELHDMYSIWNNGYYEEISNNELLINYEKLLSKLDTLPNDLKAKIIKCLFNEITSNNIDKEILKKLRKIILNHFTSMNLKTSASQPIKGLFLNGFSKSLTYVNQKIAKK